jgi:RNA polymerase sigma-54 factor
MKTNISLQQKLSWKMNKQLSQAIKMLQYNTYELKGFIEEMTKDNPFIEVENDWESWNGKTPSPKSPSDYLDKWDVKQSTNLYDVLKFQLGLLKISPILKKMVEYGIDCLDENGYLTITIDEWTEKFPANRKEIEEALTILQSFEPAGVGARSLQECLLLQLIRGNFSPMHEEIISCHFQWVVDGKVDLIAQKMELTQREVEAILHDIQSLHPRPGTVYSQQHSDIIIPDAEVFKENNNWMVKISSLHQPTIIIHHQYLKPNLTMEEKRFVERYVKQGEWLKQTIQQRYQTMEKVFAKIVEKQLSFFEFGERRIKPLTLKDIAHELNLHISTISRVIQGKYFRTPHGVYPVKFFFQPKMKSSVEDVSAFTTKQFIKELILKEDKTKPLSDQEISDYLKGEKNITISRRTVAKYREELHIFESRRRRRRNND